MFYDAEPFCAKRFYSELVKCFQFRFDLISITDVGKTVVLMFLMVCLMFSCYVLTKRSMFMFVFTPTKCLDVKVSVSMFKLPLVSSCPTLFLPPFSARGTTKLHLHIPIPDVFLHADHQINYADFAVFEIHDADQQHGLGSPGSRH